MSRATETAHTVRLYRSLKIARPRKRLPSALPPTTIEREYAKAILALLDRVRPLFDPLLSELPRLLQSVASDQRVDAGEAGRIRQLIEKIKARIRQLIEEIKARIFKSVTDQEVTALAQKFAARTSVHQRVQFSKQIRAALGIDVTINDRPVNALLEAHVHTNVGLIKDIPVAMATAIESRVLRAVQTGTLHKDLAKELEAEFDFSRNRARLIASDQVGKLYGQINAMRQQAIGVSKFVWRTAKDERVRPVHRAREGKTYSYDKPPDGEMPGQAVRCRCFAEPVLDDILALAENG